MALRYLHKFGIVYRDLKSDNVLIWSLDLDNPVNAKLADYGISRFANPGGVKGEEGTPGYLAPEAIRRRGEDQAFDEKVSQIFKRRELLSESFDEGLSSLPPSLPIPSFFLPPFLPPTLPPSLF